MEETKHVITIGNRNITVIEREIEQRDLVFYKENPRVFTAIQSLGEAERTQEKIQEIMINRDHVKTLQSSIKAHGGLMVPIIVKGNVVIEGNSRLAAYRRLSREDPKKWAKIKCSVLPDDFSEEMIDYLLCNYHIIGQTPWSPFEKAGQLYRTKQRSRKPIDVIAAELGMKSKEVNLLINVYQAMIDAEDIRPAKWSFYFELYKNPSIAKADKENPELNLVEQIVEKIRDDELEDAHKDIRDIAKVVKSQRDDAYDILTEYLEGDLPLQEAVELAGDLNKEASIKKATANFKKILNEDSDFIKQLIKNDSDLVLTLKQIQNDLEGIIKY